jgi:cytochrome P450
MACPKLRRAIEDDVVGRHHSRRGTTVIIPIHHIHHDERWWPDPEAFDPGRFRVTDRTGPRSAYLPFGGGRRICIGQSFALMEMVLMAAIMSQRFVFGLSCDSAGHPVDLEATLTLRPGHGLPMTGSRRP